MQSPTIGALAAALATARAKFEPLKKGRTAKIESQKGGYSYQYADLSDLYDCVVPALSANGLAITQALQFRKGQIVVETQLSHASGEWLCSRYPVAAFQRAQDQGSAITYAKRYAVSALLSVASEDDDDGAAASKATPLASHRSAVTPAHTPTKFVSKDEIAAIFDAAKLAGAKTKDDAHNMVGIILPGVKSVSGVPAESLTLVLTALAGMQPTTDADAPGDAAE